MLTVESLIAQRLSEARTEPSRFVLKNSNTRDPAGQENVDLCRPRDKVAAFLINTFAPSTTTI
jgi:hypothetical protein